MKLFDGRSSQQPSLSEQLNDWLWPQLNSALFGSSNRRSETGLSEVVVDPASHFAGIGTLGCSKGYSTFKGSDLSESQLATQKLILFGTGVGCEPPVQALPLAWDVRCVRGPLSARKLGLPASKAITDATILVAQVFEASSQAEGCSFIPDVHHANEADESWQRICEQANLRYIDPRWPIEKVLRAIASSERVLAEEMQGAMLADALRIPWIPIVTSPRICAFEWQDWCASIELFYHPYRLPALKSYSRWDVGVHALQHWFSAALEGPASTPQYELFSAENILAQRLANIAKQAPTLSCDETFSQKLEALQACFSQFCQQYARDTVMH
ncbi:MAG: polysaccharide pyruvyl transferase family protein [Cyanobacteria bacterium J06621_11]